MVEYCEICSEELDPDEEAGGLCKNCKKTQNESKGDEDYVDPGIT